ncbi:MAG: hypothetical protein HY054_13025 [Proteobacteria bacterium]|nr:hypothetical protein [Pseudomonadota bacterium]
MQLDDMRTVSALRLREPSADAVARLSDRVLRAAAQNPDHSEAGRAAAAEVLRARGLSVDPWDASVRGFLKLRNLDRGDMLFFGSMGALVRDLSGAVAFWSAVLLFMSIGAAALTGAAPGGEALRTFLAPTAGISATVWFLASVFRRKLARVTVLRSGGHNGAALRRFIHRELRAYGHIISLSADSGAGVTVRSASSYRAVAQRLRHRTVFNLRMLFSEGEGLALSADEAWLSLVVGMLARSSDVLIVDMSAGSSWAWSELQRLGLLNRAVFVADWSKQDAAESGLHALEIAQPCFVYAPDGEVQRRSRFRTQMLGAMRVALGAAA